MIPAKKIDGELWELQQQLKMDLRDYFAAKAMPELIGFGSPESGAKTAYQWADAMLKEREK